MEFFVYLVRCSDNSLYCGFTNDLKKRIHDHNFSDRGAKYTKKKRPVKLVYFQKLETKSLALKKEIEIKKLSKQKKEELVRGFAANLPQNP